MQFLFQSAAPISLLGRFFDWFAYHASPRESSSSVFVLLRSSPDTSIIPRAVNLLIYSRRFLEFCQPRPQSALVLFTLLVVYSRLCSHLRPRCSPSPSPRLFYSFRASSLLYLASSSAVLPLRQRHRLDPPRPRRKFHFRFFILRVEPLLDIIPSPPDRRRERRFARRSNARVRQSRIYKIRQQRANCIVFAKLSISGTSRRIRDRVATPAGISDFSGSVVSTRNSTRTEKDAYFISEMMMIRTKPSALSCQSAAGMLLSLRSLFANRSPRSRTVAPRR